MNDRIDIKKTMVIKKQGKCICEIDDEDYLVMTPDGQVEGVSSKKKAERICKKWFKDNIDESEIGIGKIEWRT